jgi:hypothetical protein
MRRCTVCGGVQAPGIYWSELAMDPARQIAVAADECSACGSVVPVPGEVLAMAEDLGVTMVRRALAMIEARRAVGG